MNNKRLLKHLAVLFISALLLAACGNNDAENGAEVPEEDPTPPGETENQEEPEEEPDESEVSQNLEDWFPTLENVHYVYEGEGIEFASFEWTPQFIAENTFQVTEATGGTTVAQIYEYRDDEIVRIFSREETYFRENFIDTSYPSSSEETETILQLPIEEGHSWESETGASYEITGLDVEIDTPSGSYNALEVTRILDGYKVVNYYAEGVGLVHTVSYPQEEGMEEVTSTLAEIHEDTPEILPVTLYSLNEDASGLNEIEAELSLNTNDPARLALASALRGEIPETEDMPLLTENVEINFMFLDENNIANIDFTEELITEMNAGSGIEMLILQGIVNTIGDYYLVNDVLLTVEGEPYTSGHIELEEGETLEVDDSDVN
ncbi:GerMN domain-containing protein [Amphibacillus sp. Q70]|uniref:GerMN domain-containing protein n=1 Tax=Amphibacillus sp. Q70 TaxID=3453416 RepID=UPI003F830075